MGSSPAAPGAPVWTGSPEARPAPREDKPCEKPLRAQRSGSGPPRGWRFRWAQLVSDYGRLHTGLEGTLGSSPAERGPVGWPPICSWGLSRTQKGMGSRAQGAGLGPEARRRGRAGWRLPGPRPQQSSTPVAVCLAGTGQGRPPCQASVCDGDPEVGRRQLEAESSQRWGAGLIRPGHGFGTFLSQHLPLFNSCFQQGFSLSSPTNQAKGGVQRGTGHST